MAYYRFTLPGADTFARFLDGRLPNMVVADGPLVQSHLRDGTPYREEWIISHDGDIFGTYQKWAKRDDEDDFRREYQGIIPGYVNLEIAAWGEKVPAYRRGDLRVVTLRWANQICVVETDSYGWKNPIILYTPWQRQDLHHSIPFP